MTKRMSMLLAAGAPALGAFLWGSQAQAACRYYEGTKTFDCGGSCGKHKVDWAHMPCRNSSNGCQEREFHGLVVCQGCPEAEMHAVPLCQDGLCSCKRGS
jgi:hypothetical protein